MNVGLTDIINNLGEKKANLSQKEKFNFADFSDISEKFSHVYDKQFMQQFDYQNLFQPQGSTCADFMSSTATSFTNNLSVEQDFFEAPSYSESLNFDCSSAEISQNSSKSYEQSVDYNKASSNENKVDNSALKTENQVSKNQTSSNAEAGSSSLKNANENNEASSGVIEGENTDAEVNSNIADKGDKKEISQDNEKMTLKAKLEANTQLDAKQSVETKELRQEVKTALQGKEIEIKVEAKPDVAQEQKVDAKNVQEQGKAQEVKQEVKQEATVVQNKVSMERLSANLDGQDAEVNSDGENKTDVDKKVSDVLNQIMGKSSDTSKNQGNMANQQGFQHHQLLQQQMPQAQQVKVTSADTNNTNFDVTLSKLNSNNAQNTDASAKAMNTPMPNKAMEKDVVNQVLKNIKGNISAQKSNITMILKPEQLGKVTINILNQRGVMTTEIKAETQQAADALNKNIADLRETLKEQGVTFENLVVKVESPNKSENNSQFDLGQQNLKDFQQENASGSNKDAESQNSAGDIDMQNAQEALGEDMDAQKENTEKDESSLVDYRV